MHPTYKKMLKKMEAKEAKRSLRKRRAPEEPWFLYILRCADGSLYTGVTKDLARRFKMHSDGKASRYTRTRRPLEMLYRETCEGRTAALVRECAVKAYPKQKKEALILSGVKGD